MDENQCNTVGQQEELQQGNKRTIDLTFETQGTHMGPGTNQVFKTKPAEPMGLQNELMVENQMPRTMSNPTPFMNHIPNNYTFLPERKPCAAPFATTKDMHMKNLNVTRRHVENDISDLCQRRCRDGYIPIQQHSHAEGIGQDVIRAKTNGENLQKTKENINQGGSQSVLTALSLPPFQVKEGDPRGITSFNGHQRNSCTLSKEFSESHKKQKFENGCLSICDMPRKFTPVEERLGKVERKGENNVKSIGKVIERQNNTLLSSYIESSRMIERQNKGINKSTSDSRPHPNHIPAKDSL
ncbi:transcriptional activator DEMETER-like isoform X1 [Prunus yedoensis var. nudiflora]|uniref:Transcriptional activator DEMETER-like isoform X1 n=1 Tax=Prunus yedoensis var. nudiflora TaxID=2094558 RepID=A0A314ZKP2_PRUYE|nr:transcriptional activator DEMETER-like isoform X1 [Prunus yedoensis var. nudiflora]